MIYKFTDKLLDDFVEFSIQLEEAKYSKGLHEGTTRAVFYDEKIARLEQQRRIILAATQEYPDAAQDKRNWAEIDRLNFNGGN